MKWTCDKCGKEMELSQEQLVETGGAVVCPQCLTSAVVPGFSARKSDRPTSHTTPPVNPIPPIPHNTMASNSTTPPARRQTISFVETPARTTPPPHQGRSKTTTTPPSRNNEPPAKTQPKKKNGKKKSKTGLLNPPGPLGCLLRTVWYTAILLAVYLLMGLVLGM